VILSYAVSLLAATLAVVAAQMRGSLSRPENFWLVTAGLLLLACITYGAMFTLIGTLFYRRAMVFCAGYMIVVEFMLANVPALIRSFTIRCHLQEIAILGYGWIMPLREEPYRLIYGEFPLWLNILALLLFVSLPLGISAFFVVRKEFITADET
jgi:ABC-type transport system involved in multi-copper enzyme maturation permease subunit